MNEARRKRIVYVVFGLAVIWGLYNQPWKRPTRDKAPVESISPAAAQAQMTANSKADAAQRPATQTEAADWTTNPFQPINYEEPVVVSGDVTSEVTPPALQGTMTVGARQLCVLDGQVYRTGDRIGIWTVSGIESGLVTLTGAAGETIKLSTGEKGS